MECINAHLRSTKNDPSLWVQRWISTLGHEPVMPTLLFASSGSAACSFASSALARSHGISPFACGGMTRTLSRSVRAARCSAVFNSSSQLRFCFCSAGVRPSDGNVARALRQHSALSLYSSSPCRTKSVKSYIKQRRGNLRTHSTC